MPRRMATVLRFLAHYSGAVLGLCAVALLWAGIAQFLSSDREHAEQSAVQSTANLARAFEEHIIRSIQAIDQTLLNVRDAYSRDPASFDLVRWSRDAVLPDPGLQIGIIGKNGFLLATSITRIPGPIDVSDREHFQFHTRTDRDELFISQPVRLRANNVVSIQLTRRINAADGSFAGVVTASLDPSRLARFY